MVRNPPPPADRSARRQHANAPGRPTLGTIRAGRKKGGTLPPARRLHPLAYGIERIGLIALRAPIVGAVIFALLVVGAVFGLDRLKVDDSLSQLFRSDTPEFKQYEEVTARFPSSEFDVLVVVEGKDLLAPRRRSRSCAISSPISS